MSNILYVKLITHRCKMDISVETTSKVEAEIQKTQIERVSVSDHDFVCLRVTAEQMATSAGMSAAAACEVFLQRLLINVLHSKLCPRGRLCHSTASVHCFKQRSRCVVFTVLLEGAGLITGPVPSAQEPVHIMVCTINRDGLHILALTSVMSLHSQHVSNSTFL